MDRHVVADPSHSLLRLAVCGAVAVADRGGGLSPATGGQHAVAVHLAARVLCVRGVDGGGDRRPLLRGAPGTGDAIRRAVRRTERIWTAGCAGQPAATLRSWYGYSECADDRRRRGRDRDRVGGLPPSGVGVVAGAGRFLAGGDGRLLAAGGYSASFLPLSAAWRDTRSLPVADDRHLHHYGVVG